MIATNEAIWIWNYLGYRKIGWHEIERFEVGGGSQGIPRLEIQYRPERGGAKRLTIHLHSVHGLDIDTLEEGFRELARTRAPRLEQ